MKYLGKRGAIMAQDMTDKQTNPDIAVDFLRLVVVGHIDEAYNRYVDMQGKHHNIYFPAGFPTLKKAMIDNHNQYQNKRLNVIHVISDGDLVVVHSNIELRQGEQEMLVVHIFRFSEGKIIEMWDVGQEIPKDSTNLDGAY